MDRGIWQRCRGLMPIIALGLATPLLALTAMVAHDGSDHHELVSVADDRTPTPLPVTSTTSTTTTAPAAGVSGASTSTPDSAPPTAGGTSSATTTSAPHAGSSTKSSSSKAGSSSKSGSSKSSKGTTSGGSAATGGSTSGGSTSGGSSGGSSDGSGGTGGSSGGGTDPGGGGSSPTTTVHTNLVFSDAMTSYGGPYGTGAAFGPWSVLSDGGGSVSGSGSGLDVSSPGGFGAVVAGSYGDLDLSVSVTSVSPGSSTDSARVLWHEVDATRFAMFTIGTSGWKIIRVDPAEPGGLGLKTLASGSGGIGTLGAGVTKTLRVVQIGTSVTVYVNGTVLRTVTDSLAPITGAVGLGSNSAETSFANVAVRTP